MICEVFMLSPDFNIDQIFASEKKADWESNYRTIGFIEDTRYFCVLKRAENNNLIAECRIGINENTCLTILFHSFLLTNDVKETITNWVKGEFEKLEETHFKLKRLGFISSNKAQDKYHLEIGDWRRIEVRRHDQGYVIETQEKLDFSFKRYFRTLKETISKKEVTEAIRDHFNQDLDMEMFPYMNDELRDLILKNE